MKQINLRKQGPSAEVFRLEWSTWITDNCLEWFEHKVRTGKYVQVGDNTNGHRQYPTEAAALAAQQRAIKKKLAEGYEYRDEPPPPAAELPSKAWTKQLTRPAWHAKLDLARLRKLIKKAKLEHRGADIESLVRPGIRLKLKTVKSTAGVVTRFGGDPQVPAEFRWPKGLAFVGQLRLEELVQHDLEALLPKRGVLALFANLVPEDGYGERAKAFHFPDAKRLVTRVSPDVDDGRPTKMAIATPRIGVTLPPPDSSAAASLHLSGDERSRYHDGVWLPTTESTCAHQLFGWPSQMNQHAFRTGWELLAQIDSDDRLGLELGDVETLRFHIARTKFAAKDFAAIRSAIGGE